MYNKLILQGIKFESKDECCINFNYCNPSVLFYLG